MGESSEPRQPLKATVWIGFLLAGLMCGCIQPPQTKYHSRSASSPSRSESASGLERKAVTRRSPFVSIYAEPLPPGLGYPVTPAEVGAALDALPAGWRETVASVRLCHRPRADVMAETDGENIELHYVVDLSGRASIRPGEPTEEEELFGAVPHSNGRSEWVHWPRPALLRTYVLKHLLIHEIGHHLAPPDLDETADEEWAENFAFDYYCPVCD